MGDHFKNSPKCAEQYWPLWKAMTLLGTRWVGQDEGQDLKTKTFQYFTEMLGVHKRWIRPYHLESNGVIQRINHTLKNVPAKAVNENQDDCNLWLPLEHIRRLCIHPHVTPYHMLKTSFHEHKILWARLFSTFQASCITQIPGLETSCTKCEPGWWQSVETSFSHLEEGLSPKLVCLWQGPDVIIKKISDVV